MIQDTNIASIPDLRLLVPAVVLLCQVDGVPGALPDGTLLLRRLRQHRGLHLRDRAQVRQKRLWGLPGETAIVIGSTP